MAKESALWKRCKTGAVALRNSGHLVDLNRVEPSGTIGCGMPDVEGCINGYQLWIELKSCMRPAKKSTPIRPKVRLSQDIWHRERVQAGCKINWVLIQVGEDHKACLYLIPGKHYDRTTVPEAELARLSAVIPGSSICDVLLRAIKGW